MGLLFIIICRSMFRFLSILYYNSVLHFTGTDSIHTVAKVPIIFHLYYVLVTSNYYFESNQIKLKNANLRINY